MNNTESSCPKDLRPFYNGSVKNTYVKSDDIHSLYFDFSDDYSIFDYGKMPDSIRGKGPALKNIAKSLFNILGNPEFWRSYKSEILIQNLSHLENVVLETFCSKGVTTHFIGEAHFEHQTFLHCQKMHVRAPQKFEINGHWNYLYSPPEKVCENEFIPLEIIFRLGAPHGSSLFKRVWDESSLLKMGLKNPPGLWERFPSPCIEFSTKLEPVDRLLEVQEAQHISALSDIEFEILKAHGSLIARFLNLFFQSIGIELWDGKFEFAFSRKGPDDIQFILVDSIGPDEIRLTYKGVQLSKEILRQYYLATPWPKEWMKEKENLSSIQSPHLAVSQKTRPPLLDLKTKKMVSLLYQNLAEIITLKEKHFFQNIKVQTQTLLEDLIQRVKESRS